MEIWHIIERVGKGVLRRRKRLLFLATLGVLVVAVPTAYFLAKEPPRYKSTAIVLLEARPTNVPLFQDLSPFRPLPVQLAILQSRSLAESVVDNLPRSSFQDLIDSPYYVDYWLEFQNWIRRLRGREPLVDSPQRRAFSELQNARVNFKSKGEFGIVELSAEASKPQVAVDIVNTFIEVLLSRTRSFNVDDARVSREFLEQQVADVKKSLGGSEEALRAFTNSNGGVRIPDRSQAVLARLSQVESSLAEAESNRKMVDARLQGMREKLESQKKAAAAAPAAPPQAPPQPPSPMIGRLREQLVQLEKTLLDLRTKFTDEHPRVVLVKDRISEIQRQLGSAVKESVPTTPAAGLVPPAERINFAEQVVALETSVVTLSAQEEALRKEADALRRNLSGLSRGEMEYSRLLREVESQRNMHAMLADKLAAARIREQGEMKVVKVIDPPGPAGPSQGGKWLKFVAIAFLASLGLGAAVPATAEIVLRTVETEADIESTTGLPVLAVIPKVRVARPAYAALSEVSGRRGADENFMFVESFRSLRVATQIAVKTENIHSLLIASPMPGEGKSMVAMNLAFAFGEIGWRVVLADTDFARPAITKIMKVQRSSGLADVLSERRTVEQSLALVGEGVWLAPQNTSLQPRSRGLLATEKLKGLVTEMGGHAELVICDSSPTLLVPESLFLASSVDAVILVAKAGATGCRELARAKAALDSVGAKILGVVINEMPPSALRGYYQRYYQSYVRSEKK